MCSLGRACRVYGIGAQDLACDVRKEKEGSFAPQNLLRGGVLGLKFELRIVTSPGALKNLTY